MRRLLVLVVLLRVFGLSCAVLADSREAGGLQRQVEELQRELQQLKTLMAEQQKKITALESGRTEPQPSGVSTVAGNTAPMTPPIAQKAGSAKLPFIPDIGVVGDIVGTQSSTLPDDEGNDRFSLRELELVLGSDLDPYARFDSTITFSDFESPDVEEAYVSYWGLPGEIKGRIGRMHQRVGKASATHRDSLDTVDEPLVVQKYLGVEGLFRTGLDFSGFLPFSTDIYTPQWSIGMMEGGVGEGGQLFADAPTRPSFYGHLSNFWDFSDVSNFELGGTYLLGSAKEDSYSTVNAFGIDGTLIHHFSPRNKFKLQSELYFARRSQTADLAGTEEPAALRSNPFGFYVLADYRLAERWGIGSRYDWVEPIQVHSGDSRNEDQAISGYLTFYQSEFARWRFQYEYARLADGQNDSRFFLQGTFAIGTHKHQIQ
jgi:hypothetical protein